MTIYLCISVRFIQPYYHGRADRGEPEWPPSPLRLFQSLVASAAALWRTSESAELAATALRWLELQHPPLLIAPATMSASKKYRLYVPDNVGDVVAKSWCSDRDASFADYRVEKDVQPIRLHGDAVHFVFPLADGACPQFEILLAAARSITHLGWGIDMAVGDAAILSEKEVASLTGEHWQPAKDNRAKGYRTPRSGTLDALASKHQEFLKRIGTDGFKPVSPLSAFRVVGYRRAIDPVPRECAAFTILRPDATGMRSFDPLRRTRDVAGMLRHAVAEEAHNQGWAQDRINVFVHGKSRDGSKPTTGHSSPDRFQYLPLPTINFKLKRVESIRRVLIVAPSHCVEESTWARRAMAGCELVNHDGVAALLTILPTSDWVFEQYTNASQTWSTVTPVILPGYDDPDHLRRKLKDIRDAETQKRYLSRLDERMENLIRKAFRQAGYSDELMAQAEIEWRNVGFRAGVELAARYLPPENLDKSPRYHVKVRFPVPVSGPIAVGSGRFRGFGLFAKVEDS